MGEIGIVANTPKVHTFPMSQHHATQHVDSTQSKLYKSCMDASTHQKHFQKAAARQTRNLPRQAMFTQASGQPYKPKARGAVRTPLACRLTPLTS